MCDFDVIIYSKTKRKPIWEGSQVYSNKSAFHNDSVVYPEWPRKIILHWPWSNTYVQKWPFKLYVNNVNLTWRKLGHFSIPTSSHFPNTGTDHLGTDLHCNERLSSVLFPIETFTTIFFTIFVHFLNQLSSVFYLFWKRKLIYPGSKDSNQPSEQYSTEDSTLPWLIVIIFLIKCDLLWFN